MDENIDEYVRNLAAEGLVISFAVEVLLVGYFKQFPPEMREEMYETFLKSVKQTDHFSGLTKGDEARSEFFADVVVRAHQQADTMIRRVRQRIG